MRVIAASNAKEFYEGNMGRVFIEDLRKRGSILTEEDLAMYKLVSQLYNNVQI